MKKKYKVISILVCAILVFSAIIFDNTVRSVQAATVGQQLTAPESGWKRFDDTDANLTYTGTWGTFNNADIYNQSYKYSNYEQYQNGNCKFKFSGDRIRIIGALASGNGIIPSENISVKIDGITYSSSEVGTWLPQCIIFEKLGLANTEHNVEIFAQDNKFFVFDAVDINSTGQLIKVTSNPVTGITLNKSTDKLQVGETDTLTATISPADATNKNVTWTTSDSTIATVDSTGKVTGVKVGTVTITATTEDGGLTATCTVTVVDPSKSRAVLAITMTNNDRKEYDVLSTEAQKFIDWYNNNTSKSYKFDKSPTAPYSSKVEYITHDEISSFEISEYTASN
ncbi:MAG: Ig domain-containing protein [Clostridiaceae bacterium]